MHVMDSNDSDRISSLPDDLLHTILARLRSTAAAARTSILSRRWRHVWTQLPEVVLNNTNAIDAGLARLAAANSDLALSRLAIVFPGAQLAPLRTGRWQAFASRHVRGELAIRLHGPGGRHVKEELELPLMEKATSIRITAENIFRLPPAGSFAALKIVNIAYARMDGRDMECFSSSRCPRLEQLHLWPVDLVAVYDVSIRSESLERLFYRVNDTRRLEVVAPRLRLLRAQGRACWEPQIKEARIVAPNLRDLAWYGTYDPRCHQFVEVGRHLGLLLMVELLPMTALMQRFDTVDYLILNTGIPEGIDGYQHFRTATSKLAKCEAMELYLPSGHHAFAPSVLHVLRQSWNGLRKLIVRMPKVIETKKCDISLGCPCRLPENYMTDNIALDSLEELIILDFQGFVHHMELLNLVLECNTSKLRNLSVYISEGAPVSMETCQKIKNSTRPNVKVKFTVWPHGRSLIHKI